MAEKAPSSTTSEIQKSIQTAKSTFVTGALPEDLAKAADPTKALGNKINAAAQSLKLDKEQLGNTRQAKEFLNKLTSDPASLSAGKENILTAMGAALTGLAEQVAKLEADPHSGIPDAMIANVKAAKALSGSFANVTSISESLIGDINQEGDYYYSNLPDEVKTLLEGLAVTEGKAPNKTAALTNALEDTKSKFKTFYEKIGSVSIEYQTNVAPALGSIKPELEGLQKALDEVNTKLGEVNGEVAKLEAEQAAAYQTNLEAKAELDRLEEVISTFQLNSKAATTEASSDDATADSNDTETTTTTSSDTTSAIDEKDPAHQIEQKRKTAESKKAKATELIGKAQEKIASIKVAIAAKADYNDAVEAHRKRVSSTADLVMDMGVKLESLKKQTAGCKTQTADLKSKLFSGGQTQNILNNFVKSLNNLGAWEAKIKDANEELQKVEENGDIKSYVKGIADILGAFPESGAAVVTNTLEIGKNLSALDALCATLKKATGDLNEHLNASSLKVATVKTAGSAKDKVLANTLKADADVITMAEASAITLEDASTEDTSVSERLSTFDSNKTDADLESLLALYEGLVADLNKAVEGADADLAFVEKFAETA